MPKVNIEIKDVYSTVTRPVNTKIARQIADRLGIDPSILPEMPNLQEFFPVRGSQVGTEQRDNIYPGTSKITITVSEEYSDRNLMTTPVNNTEWPAIFRDDKIQLYISPHYRQIECTVNFTFRARDRVTIDAIRAGIQTRIDQTVFNTIHDVKYNYNIPPEIFMLLVDIHRRRNEVAPYNDTIAEWFNECFTKNYRLTATQSGLGVACTIGEGQIRIHGWFEDDPTPPQRDDSADSEGQWLTTVNYKFWYQKPEILVVNYPLVTHNQLVPNEYIDAERERIVGEVQAKMSRTEEIMQGFQLQYKQDNTWLTTPGIQIPVWDEWLEPYKPNVPYYMNLFRVMSLLVTEPTPNLRFLGNLEEDIEPWTMWPEAIAYMKSLHTKLNKPYMNVFNVQIYEWDELRNMANYDIDNQLNIGFDEDLDLRNNYHYMIGFLTDPSLLRREAIKDLANHWCFGWKYFKMLWPNLDEKKYPPPDSTCMTDWRTVVDIIEDMGKELELEAPPPYAVLPTVGNFTLIAKRR